MNRLNYFFIAVLFLAFAFTIASCEKKEDEPQKKTTTTNNGNGTGQNNNNNSNGNDSDDPNGASHNRTQETDFTVEIPVEKDGDISSPLTIVALDNSVNVSLFCTDEILAKLDIQYQITKHSGTAGTRTAYTTASTNIALSKGDKVSFYGNNAAGLNKLANYVKFVIEGKAAASGNIMSLIKGSGFQDLKEIPNEYCFAHLFEGCSTLVTAPMLPATVLQPSCYRDMFAKCTALTTAPKFRAQKLAEYCCYEMFDGCKALTSVSNFPDVELAEFCFNTMFRGCTALTKAPVLPAKKLAKACYSNMFKSCTALEKAPELPAVVLEESCYARMFDGCSKLKSITVGAVDWAADKKATEYWTLNVAANGVFTCPSNLKQEYGTSAIPKGWSVSTTGAAEDPRPVLSEPELSKTGSIIFGDELTLTVSADKDCDITVTVDDKTVGESKGNKELKAKLPTDAEGKFHVTISAKKGDLIAENKEFDYTVEKLRLTVNYELSNPASSIMIGEEYSAQLSTNLASEVVVTVNGENVAVKKTSNKLFSIQLPSSEKGNYDVVISAKSGDLTASETFSYSVEMPKPVLTYTLSGSTQLNQGDICTINVSSNIACNISVKVNNSEIATANGKDNLTATLPTISAGTYTVVISGDNDGAMAEDQTFSYTVSAVTPVLTYSLDAPETIYEGCDLFLVINSNAACDMTVKIDDVVADSKKDAPSWRVKLPTASEGTYTVSFSGKNGNLVSEETKFTYDVIKLIVPEISCFLNAEYSDYYVGDEVKLDIVSSTECDITVYVDNQKLDNASSVEKFSTVLPTKKAGTYNGVIKSSLGDVKGEDVKFSYTVLEPFDDGIDYLCFTAVIGGSTISLKCNNGYTTYNGFNKLDNLEYSLDKMRWKPYPVNGGTLGLVITLPTTGSKVYFRGTKGKNLNFSHCYFSMTGKINASGSVMSLIDEKCEMDMIPTDGCFSGLFSGCTNLLTAPKLPATILERNCYSSMFSGCYNLTTAPELPATELYDGCYSGMFADCKKLKRAPYLPATDLVPDCYYRIFSGCSVLNYISVNFTKWGGNTSSWVLHVQMDGGTFVCPQELAEVYQTTNNGYGSRIPNGWTIQRK
jgi:hypothetical protein